MAFFDKLNEITNVVKDKTSDVIETQKLNSKISSEKTEVAELMKKIGEYYYNKHISGEQTEPGIADFLTGIDGHQAVIQETEAQLRALKDVPAAPAAAQTSGQQAFCPSCGAALNPGMKFCNECGAKLE